MKAERRIRLSVGEMPENMVSARPKVTCEPIRLLFAPKSPSVWPELKPDMFTNVPTGHILFGPNPNGHSPRSRRDRNARMDTLRCRSDPGVEIRIVRLGTDQSTKTDVIRLGSDLRPKVYDVPFRPSFRTKLKMVLCHKNHHAAEKMAGVYLGYTFKNAVHKMVNSSTGLNAVPNRVERCTVVGFAASVAALSSGVRWCRGSGTSAVRGAVYYARIPGGHSVSMNIRHSGGDFGARIADVSYCDFSYEIPAHFAEEVGERIQKEREHLGLTQDELADNLYMSASSVSRHEHGQNLTVNALPLYAAFFGIDVHDLIPYTKPENRSLPDKEVHKSQPMLPVWMKMSDLSPHLLLTLWLFSNFVANCSLNPGETEDENENETDTE